MNPAATAQAHVQHETHPSFEDIGALSPPQQQVIPRVMEIGKKYGLEILPPPGA